MKPSDELLYDHEVLRGKLALLEDYLPAVREVPVTLSLLTDSLACCLRAHDEREEEMLAALPVRRHSPEEDAVHHLRDEHQNLRTRLAVLHELLSRPGGATDAQTVAQAEYLIRDLRTHMAEVEALFPILDAADTVECLGLA